MLNSLINLLLSEANTELAEGKTLEKFNSVRYGDPLLPVQSQPALVMFLTDSNIQVQNIAQELSATFTFLAVSSSMDKVDKAQKRANSLFLEYGEELPIIGLYPFIIGLRQKTLVDSNNTSWSLKNVGKPQFLVNQDSRGARFAVSLDVTFSAIIET